MSEAIDQAIQQLKSLRGDIANHVNVRKVHGATCPEGHTEWIVLTIFEDFLCLECSCRFTADGTIVFAEHHPSPLLDVIQQAHPPVASTISKETTHDGTICTHPR